MDNYQEYNRCVQILTAKPTGLFKKDNIEEKLKCLDYFRNKALPGSLWFMGELLLDSPPAVRQYTAETLIYIFKRLKSREELSGSLKWIQYKPEDLDTFTKTFPQETYVELLAIASFNENGFVREKAVVLLQASKSPSAIRYLLLRSADWVPQVREAALIAIRASFLPVYQQAFIRELPFIEGLLRVKRIDLSALYGQIIDFITSIPLSAPYLKSLDIPEQSKMLLFSCELKQRGLTPSLQELILSQGNFIIRSFIFKYFSLLPAEEQQRLLRQLLQDRSAKIRLYALYATKPFQQFFKEEIISFLSDESASVRVLARHRMKDDNFDFVSFYRENLKKGFKLTGNLMGLAELGSAADIPLFEKYINEPSPRLKLTCLVALDQLNKPMAKEHALSMLMSRSGRIRTKCREILSTGYNPEMLGRLRTLYRQDNPEQKKAILILYNRIGGWEVAADLIDALMDSDMEVRNLGWRFLFKWKIKITGVFTTPSPDDVARARTAYNRVTDAALPMTYHGKELWKELPFYFR